MKPIFLLLMTMLAARSIAQQKQPVVKDSLPAKLRGTNTIVTRKAGVISSTEAEIKKELGSLLAAYRTSPNTQATWSKIIGEAQNILYPYFRNGKLMGTKAEQAYFIKMGTETMTANDIANHKMILLAGIATIKPAEFSMIRIEILNSGN